jgi:MerR HTH family regulatory protein
MADIVSIENQPGSILPGYSTRTQLAKKFDCSEATIRRWEREGLRVIRRGQMRLYNDQETFEFITGAQKNGPRKPGRPRS